MTPFDRNRDLKVLLPVGIVGLVTLGARLSRSPVARRTDAGRSRHGLSHVFPQHREQRVIHRRAGRQVVLEARERR